MLFVAISLTRTKKGAKADGPDGSTISSRVSGWAWRFVFDVLGRGRDGGGMAFASWEEEGSKSGGSLSVGGLVTAGIDVDMMDVIVIYRG